QAGCNCDSPDTPEQSTPLRVRCGSYRHAERDDSHLWSRSRDGCRAVSSWRLHPLIRYALAVLRSDSIRGARLFGLSRLKDWASPKSARTNSSVRATAEATSLLRAMNVIHAIDSLPGSYSHS